MQTQEHQHEPVTSATGEGEPIVSFPAPHPLAHDATKEQKEEHEKALALHNAMKQTITVKEDKDVKVLKPIAAVFRNGIAAPLYETDIARVKAGSDKAGLTYPSIHLQWAKDHTSEFLQWLGNATSIRWCVSKLKGVAQALMEEACDDLRGPDGKIIYYQSKGKNTDDAKPDYQTFNPKAFLDLMEDLSPRSETLAEINAAIMDIVNQMSELEVMEYIAKYGSEEGPKLYSEAMKKLKHDAQSYKSAKEKKKRHKTTLVDGAEETAGETVNA